MAKENKKSTLINRAKNELKKIREGLEKAEIQRDNLTLSIEELKAFEKHFTYLIEELEG